MEKMLTINSAKPKSIIIDGELHNRFKVICKGKNLKIGGVIEDLVRLYINNPTKILLLVEELKGDESEEEPRKKLNKVFFKK